MRSGRLTSLRIGAAAVVAVVTTLMMTPSATDAAPIIQEVLYDGSGTDAPDAFTELFGQPGLSLDGWSLVGINGGTGASYRTVDLMGGTIPSDGVFVVATRSANAALAAVQDFTGSVDWQNGPDAVQLIDPFGAIVDALQYGDAGPNNAGFGGPGPDASAGFSLSRDAFGTNTFDNLTDFFVADPTPGLGPILDGSDPPPPPPPDRPVPEPSALALLALGTSALVRLRR